MTERERLVDSEQRLELMREPVLSFKSKNFGFKFGHYLDPRRKRALRIYGFLICGVWLGIMTDVGFWKESFNA